MNELKWETADEKLINLANRVRMIRKRKNITQEDLSLSSGVSFGSIKRFETTGQISLISLAKIAIALDCSSEIDNMFNNIKYMSIEEVINENK
ncbi:MAG: helix-turn-helix domain-containing protein [Acholeplasmatales bacterium]|nr:helix-turn-helix domain-containing protein [Acholeplasmatales bacterium]